jgi:hypothetical protein
LQKRFWLLRLASGRDGFARIGDLGQVGGRGRVCGLLSAQVVKPRLEASQSVIAAFG